MECNYPVISCFIERLPHQSPFVIVIRVRTNIQLYEDRQTYSCTRTDKHTAVREQTNIQLYKDRQTYSYTRIDEQTHYNVYKNWATIRIKIKFCSSTILYRKPRKLFWYPGSSIVKLLRYQTSMALCIMLLAFDQNYLLYWFCKWSCLTTTLNYIFHLDIWYQIKRVHFTLGGKTSFQAITVGRNWSGWDW